MSASLPVYVRPTARIFALWAIVLCVISNSAAGAVTFRYASGSPTHVASPGAEVVVTLLLFEERASGSDISVLTSEQGVFGFDVRVQRTSGADPIVDVLANVSIFALPFSTVYQPNRPLPLAGVANADFAVSAFDNPGPTGAPNGLSRSLVIGTVTVKASAIPGDISTFSIMNSPMGTNTVTNQGTPLDSMIASGSFTVQSNCATPAPLAASVSPTVACPGASIMLSADAAPGTSIAWYTGSCGGSPVGTGNPLTTTTPAASTTYYARAEGVGCNSACVEATLAVRSPAPQQLPRAGATQGDEFGWHGSCSTDGTRIVVGAPQRSSGPGYASVYQRGTDGLWVLQQRIDPPTGVAAPSCDGFPTVPQYFGNKTAIAGDHLLVAARFSSACGQTQAGVVYAYRLIGGTWQYQQTLIAVPAPAALDEFGHGLAVSGNYAIVGCIRREVTVPPGSVLTDAGTAYIYRFDGASWVSDATLIAPDASTAGARRLFGLDADIDGDTAIVGAFKYDVSSAPDVGAAYVFRRNGAGAWLPEQTLQPSPPLARQIFGDYVRVDGHRVIVGSTDDTSAGRVGAGSAYVFARSGSTWTQEAKLFAADVQAGDHMGFACDIRGQYAVVGSFGSDSGALSDAGAVYIFKRTANGWRQADRVRSPTASNNGRFGFGVVLSDPSMPGAFVVAAAFREPVGVLANAGTAAALDLNNLDCNDDGIPDACQPLLDTNGDGIPDGCPKICPGDFNGSGTVTVGDIFAFLTAWFAADPSADFNVSGGPPTVADIFAFLAAWFAPCV